jgi:thymidylate synthase (FAD)
MEENGNLPPRIEENIPPAMTRREMNEGGEKWLYRPIPCLDHGFIYLVDYMGNDHSIAAAARESRGRSAEKGGDDRGLIRRLYRDTHTSPFEMAEFKFHAKLPIFVARQWIRHRTANVNEYSGRYSEMSEEFYLPKEDILRYQSETNKQGRSGELTSEEKKFVLDLLRAEYAAQLSGYKKLLGMNVARELARVGLSVANYTEWYWKIDLHNLLHFLRLRLHTDAQYEIRVFAEAMARIAKDSMPLAYEAFEDYRLLAVTLSRMEIEFVKEHILAMPMPKALAFSLLQEKLQDRRGTETKEGIAKFERLGLVES